MPRVEGYVYYSDGDTAGDAVIAAIIAADAIGNVTENDDGTVVVLNANAPEQIEAALAKAGWKMIRTKKK